MRIPGKKMKVLMHFYMVLEEVNKDMFVRLVGPKTSLPFFSND